MVHSDLVGLEQSRCRWVGRFYAVLNVLLGLVQELFVPAERPGDGTKLDLPSIELCDNAGVY